MQLSLLTGRSNPALASSLASELNNDLVQTTVADFPDAELNVVIHDNVQGHDVFLLQSIAPPAANHLLELLMLADACKRAGAERLTAVIPYFGYARQDRREEPGQPVGARLLADLLGVRIQRIVTLDLHNPAVEGFFTIPVEHLTAVELLAEKLRSSIPENSVLVAPDLGAVKLAQRYAALLDLPVAYIHKIRHSCKEVSVQGVTGEIKDRMPVIVDDMISTGGTMISAIEALLEMGCRTPVTLSAAHGLLVSKTAHQLATLPIAKIILTNSLPRANDVALPLEYVSISSLLANTIKRLHRSP
ncbi:MAG: ribose-phosphate pyrophosphokinase [Desulfobacterales bacterium]|jgi:ribose-phosphate pyrophosphokinase